MVTKEELATVIKDQLHIQLQDPINDLDIIFGSYVIIPWCRRLCRIVKDADSERWGTERGKGMDGGRESERTRERERARDGEREKENKTERHCVC
jgi:hypothetical protein